MGRLGSRRRRRGPPRLSLVSPQATGAKFEHAIGEKGGVFALCALRKMLFWVKDEVAHELWGEDACSEPIALAQNDDDVRGGR